MRPRGGLSGSPSDAAFASHTRLLGARVWLVNFSSKFNVPAGLIKCLLPIPARCCFCLSSLRSSPQSSTPILSGQCLGPTVTILVKWLGCNSHKAVLSNHIEYFFSGPPFKSLRCQSSECMVYDSRKALQAQSHRNLPFLSLLQTYPLLRTYTASSMGSCPGPHQMNGLRFSQGLSNHIEFSLHLPVFAVLSLTRWTLVCDLHRVLLSHWCFTSLPGFAVFSLKFSKLVLFGLDNGTSWGFVSILIGCWFCEGFGIPILFRLRCDIQPTPKGRLPRSL